MQSFLKSGKLAGPSKSTSTVTHEKRQVTPWVEKYRPSTVNDVVEQKEVVSVLQQCLEGADLPNLLLYGPPGTGKTSTILAAARQLFGDMYKNRILELNASDERGIQVIRNKVKTFAQLTASSIRPDGRPCPPFKIIILDEADSMTHAAQAALRRTMEREMKTTRFCLICNYVSRIIEPITSRCTKFRFKPLNESMILERLEFICKKEEVQCSAECLNTLVRTSGGDMRRAITCLQSCSRLKGKHVPVSIDDVIEITGVIPEDEIQKFIKVCTKNDFKGLQEFIDVFSLSAYSAAQLMEQFNDILVSSTQFTDNQKAIIGEKLALTSFRLQDGASEAIQLLDLGCGIITATRPS
ncbi:uncharacterized protein CBL_06778 [Carabus blaptoides fortunei]